MKQHTQLHIPTSKFTKKATETWKCQKSTKKQPKLGNVKNQPKNQPKRAGKQKQNIYMI